MALPTHLRPQELERLFAGALSSRDRLVLLIGAYAGLPVSEIVNLQVGHCDFKGSMLGTVPMHDRVAWELKAYLADRQTGWVFPAARSTDHLAQEAVQVIILDAARRAQITRPITPQLIGCARP